ncbi:beta-glucosidase 42 [Phtheirospermum japonicum]|uniref:Beta-glucosidase 42 n=1 Tax=Phtheirospermum japonicum TaxID=374723 RepID=A0A830B0Y7_9LAMI|nr:beta-glucosidase 42 [Phtheirospermum japonicum]
MEKSIAEGLEKKRMDEEWTSVYSSKQSLRDSAFLPTSPSVPPPRLTRLKGLGMRTAGDQVFGMLFAVLLEDIDLIVKLGFKAYRFSISWSCFFLDGLGTQVNAEGTRYSAICNTVPLDLPLNLHESFGENASGVGDRAGGDEGYCAANEGNKRFWGCFQDVSVEKKSRTSQSEVNVTESNGMKNDEKADADNSISHSRREGLDFLLRRVKIDSQVKQSNGSNIPIQTKSNCGALFSKADILCSCDAAEILNEMLVSMLVSTKMCCDHPYLVDGSLFTSLIQDIPKPELLDAAIKLSNILLLLHKVLLEIKKRDFRVLILYQSLGGSQSFSLGDILDEFIQQTLGTDISVHIAGRLRVSRSKRRVALKSFNDKANMKFVCLMETRSCIPSVTLSSIDTVIFFNSDWNPINHLKALQRIELDSRFQDLNVFRFYSSHTLEEKVLILAKQGRPLEDDDLENVFVELSSLLAH